MTSRTSHQYSYLFFSLALSGLNDHRQAIENYKKAIELDPTNQNFKTNLEIAEEKAASAPGENVTDTAGGILSTPSHRFLTSLYLLLCHHNPCQTNV